MLKPGDQAPDFTLSNSGGRAVALSALLAEKPVVLYFYPKDFTPGCTAEACAFRDAYEDFVAAGAEVVGISSDSGESHGRFAEKHRLPFVLLADPGGKTRRLFGVPRTLGILDGRVTFVIDRGGVIRHVFRSQLGIARHVRGALDTVRSLAPGGRPERGSGGTPT